ncbi:GumK N-terminal domain-containing glycosyltransferase [Acetobacter nitrogenifigens]|nr:glycosyltransferase [Acetobacter nitrogenifigens]
MTDSLVISVHDFRSRRKASVHFIARELARRGRTRFFSTGLSRLSEHRGDTRADLAAVANSVELSDGVECYLQRGLWHPFRLNRAALGLAEAAMFRLYRLLKPGILKRWIRDADTVFVESGLAAIFVPDIRKLNPRAKIVYLASDDLGVIGAARTIRQGFLDNFDAIDLVRLPSPLLLSGMPHARSAIFAPQGVDRALMERPRPSPFSVRRACVSVGSMLFDASFFNMAAPSFPDLDFYVIGAGRAAEALDKRPNIIVLPETPFEETLGYIQHAAFGVAPYRDADTPRYLLDTSLKLRQFAFFGKPAVCPDFAAGGDAGRFAYKPGDAASIAAAVTGALANTTPISVDLPDWSEVVDRLLYPERFPEHRLEQQSDKPVTAIYRTEVLPLSETFVRDQALALQRWRPVLIGERAIDKLPLEGLEARTCHTGPATFAERIIGAALRRFDLPSPGVLKIARAVKPKLIHAHFGFDGVEAWPIAKRLGAPLLVTLHGSDITTHMKWFAEGRAGRRWKRYPLRLQRLAKAQRVGFVAVSGPIRDAALAVGIPSDRVTVCHIGIDVDRFVPAGETAGKRAPVILFVGRLVEKKGATLLVKAFAKVREALPEARLIIAGDGPQRAEIEAMAPAGVALPGAVSQDRVRALMAEARVFCLPSITAKSGDKEGLPLVLLEAQASGVPVVTSASGGTTEGMEDGKTGFAFAEGDVETMARHLIAILSDDEMADRFGQAARAFIVRAHDRKLCTKRLEDVYDRLSAGKSILDTSPSS